MWEHSLHSTLFGCGRHFLKFLMCPGGFLPRQIFSIFTWASQRVRAGDVCVRLLTDSLERGSVQRPEFLIC